ncbi:MAG: patatin family protein [Oscillospiraceae bacterium]|nr:patatin family protein [Oscillospiraceae bacterium]
MKTGLILEGGAMRGLFTCGVLDVLMENGIRFDGGAGISAGAVFGCNYNSRQIGRAVRYNKRYCRDPRYCSIRSLLKTGDLYGADFCYRELPDVLDPFDRAAFAENPMEFYIGATDADTGEIRYHKCSDGRERDMLWMRGSASLPMVSRAVEVDGYRLLDGGMTDPVPYRFMEQAGFDRNLYVLTQPRGYRKGKTKGLAFMRLALRRTPKMAAVMAARPSVYNRQMDEIDAKERRGEILVLRPPEALGISRTEHDPSELERVYQIGRAQAEKALPEIRAFLTRP